MGAKFLTEEESYKHENGKLEWTLWVAGLHWRYWCELMLLKTYTHVYACAHMYAL